jgi:hypothetical protein
MDSASFLSAVLTKAFDLWTTPVIRLSINNGLPSIELLLEQAPRATIDQRIEKIDLARKNLSEALEAMEELKQAAEQNKAELATAIERLDIAHKERAAAERELEAVRGIAQSDIEVFQKLAGVPSKLEVAKERFVGFILGILASVLASVVWWLLTKAWPLLKS